MINVKSLKKLTFEEVLSEYNKLKQEIEDLKAKKDNEEFAEAHKRQLRSGYTLPGENDYCSSTSTALFLAEHKMKRFLEANCFINLGFLSEKH